MFRMSSDDAPGTIFGKAGNAFILKLAQSWQNADCECPVIDRVLWLMSDEFRNDLETLSHPYACTSTLA
jgi:hypothetical protein